MADGSIAVPRRTRTRGESFQFDPALIAKRVSEFYDADIASRTDETEARLQRYAKFRLWREGKDWPWEGCSDLALPDMTEKSLHLQDILHNAVMAQMPPVGASAISPADKDKEKTVDNLIAFQLFGEQKGELVLGEIIEAFVNDGVFTAYVPWVREKRETVELRTFPAFAADAQPTDVFRSILGQAYANAHFVPNGDGWDWSVVPNDENQETFIASFYTREDGTVEMTVERDAVVFDGPRLTSLDWDEVLHPPRAANLQMPGPSNPGGAAHVIMVDRTCTVDEIKRLAKSGYYEISADDLAKLDGIAPDRRDQDAQDQKDALQGATIEPGKRRPPSHAPLTRLICFDCCDIDGDGLDEDVIWWVLKEPQLVVRARRLTEQFPANPPRRPFAEASLLPVSGRRKGMSLLEILEGLHDASKAAFDQMTDGGTLATVPFFFYRASGGMKPETLRLEPGDGYPLADPKNDVYFPQMSNQGQVFAVNLLTLLNQMEERLTTIGDLQMGRVPAGKSSALRTAAAFSLLQGQGEARPERILRRLFIGLTEIWKQVHELNRAFLPKDKQIRILGDVAPGADPYQTITGSAAIEGRFQFGFSANVLNTSKSALQSALADLIQVFVTPLAIQLGVSTKETIYRLFRDFANAQGQDRDRYLAPPTPDANQPRVFAEDAIGLILKNEVPDGVPAEAGGAPEHLQKLIDFVRSDEFGHYNPSQVGMFKAWLQKVAQLAQQQQQQAQTMAAASAFQAQAQGGGQPGAPVQNPQQAPGGNPQISGPGEMLDEAQPGAGAAV